jgi:hypothetical protein
MLRYLRSKPEKKSLALQFIVQARTPSRLLPAFASERTEDCFRQASSFGKARSAKSKQVGD